MTTAADLLNEYANALRGDWGSIDGRSEQMALDSLAALMRSSGNDDLRPEAVASMRRTLDVCPLGDGHWTDFCDAECGGN